MAWPYREEPITDEEHQHIRDASGVLYELCEKARGTSYEERVSEQHDAMMRLRRRNEQVEEDLNQLLEALKAIDADICMVSANPENLRLVRDAISKAEGGAA